MDAHLDRSVHGEASGRSLEVQGQELILTGQRMRMTSRQPKELALGTVGLGENDC